MVQTRVLVAGVKAVDSIVRRGQAAAVSLSTRRWWQCSATTESDSSRSAWRQGRRVRVATGASPTNSAGLSRPITSRIASRSSASQPTSRRFAYTTHDTPQTTLLLTLAVHPKVVQEMLGHANVQTTLNTYSHVTETMGETAGAQLSGTILGT